MASAILEGYSYCEQLGTFDFARIKCGKLSSDPSLSYGLGCELFFRHILPVLLVVPVRDRVAGDLVSIVPPLVDQGVVRVRVGDKVCCPEQI